MANEATLPAASSPAPTWNLPILSTAAGLGWAGLMSVLAGFWLGSKHAGPLPFLFHVVGAVFVLLALWMGQVHFRKEGRQEEAWRRAGVARAFLLGPGTFFLVIGAYFLFSQGLPALAEGGGLVFLGLLLLLGSFLLRPEWRPAETLPGPLRAVQDNPNGIGRLLLALGLVLLVVYYGLFWFGLAGRGLLPELLGLGLVILLMVGLGTFLVNAPGTLTTEETRVVALAMGGLLGLSLFAATVARTLVWRESTLFGGLAAWQGEHAWRFWLCAYLGILALALMAGSLLLARTDVRGSPILRRIFYGFNTGLTALLLLLVLVVLNIVTYAMFPYQLDWTSRRGVYALSESSKNLLSRLDRETTIHLILPKGREEYQDLFTFLENCQAHTSRFQIKHVSIESDMKDLQRLVERYPVIDQKLSSVGRFETRRRRGGMLIVYGEEAGAARTVPPHHFLLASEIYEESKTKENKGAVTETFLGELVLMNQLSILMAEKKSKVYVLQGNGELDLFSPGTGKGVFRGNFLSRELKDFGMGGLRMYLAGGVYDVVGLTFDPEVKTVKGEMVAAPVEDKGRAIPLDADFVIIPGPSRPLPAEAIAALDRYLQKGGRLMVFMDLITDTGLKEIVKTGLEDLLKKYGIEVTNEFVLAYGTGNPLISHASGASDSKNELIALFQNKIITMPTSRAIRKGNNPSYTVETLLEINPKLVVTGRSGPNTQASFAETELEVMHSPNEYLAGKAFFETEKLRARLLAAAPVPVALAATPGGPGDKGTAKPQIYVFGDAEFISDTFASETVHADFVRSCLEASSDRPGLKGPRPRQTTHFMADPDTNYYSLSVVPAWIMVFSVLALGAGFWLVRRR